MAEYINKAELIKEVERKLKLTSATTIKVIESLPTIDIVHCSECRHRREFEEYNRTHNSFDLCVECEIDRKYHDDDYFCADGERKEDD